MRAIFLVVLVTLGTIFTALSLQKVDALAADLAPAVRGDVAGHPVSASAPLAPDHHAPGEVTAARLRSLWWTTLAAGIVRVLIGGLVVIVLTAAIAARDRRLEAYAADLEQRVEERTRALDQQTRGMRLVLDHVAQGFVTVDVHGAIDGERSAVFDRWFGAPPRGAQFGDLVAVHSTEFAVWFDLALQGLRDDVLPLDVVIDQLPTRFAMGEQLFEVGYSPILDGARVAHLLLIISDVTARVAHERTERAERELIAVFRAVAHDRAGFEHFVDDAAGMVATLSVPGDPVTERRTLHTLKGNCRLEGLDGFAELCHAIEDEVADGRTRRPLTAGQRARLQAGWDEVMTRVVSLLGDRARPTVAIETAGRRFGRLGAHAQELARRLGKGELDVVVRDGDLRLDVARWAPFWRALLHAISNAVDHGLEAEAERVAAGKPRRATLTLSAAATTTGLRISVEDDGRGIDWDEVRRRAARAGLPSTTEAELEAALFHDGVTTRAEATTTSGRGVGLSALRAAVTGLGGTMTIETRPRAGTTLTFLFPAGAHITPLRPPSQPLRRVG